MFKVTGTGKNHGDTVFVTGIYRFLIPQRTARLYNSFYAELSCHFYTIREGEESILRLSYHPENLLSPYSTDFKAFYSAFPQEICSVKIIETRQGPDYRILKS